MNTTVKRIGIRLGMGFMVALFAACSTKNNIPPGVLPPEEMRKVLEGIYLAEEKLNRSNISPDSSKILIGFLKDKILADKGISDSVFQQSFNYYVEHPREMELIYTALVDSLQLKEERSRKNRPI